MGKDWHSRRRTSLSGQSANKRSRFPDKVRLHRPDARQVSEALFNFQLHWRERLPASSQCFPIRSLLQHEKPELPCVMRAGPS